LTTVLIRGQVQPYTAGDSFRVRPVSEAFISKFELLAMARPLLPRGIGWVDVAHRLELFGELIIGIIVDTAVLVLGIFLVVTTCVGRQ
jgi:hypothetical protein